MKKRILAYMARMDAILIQNDTGESYGALLAEHEKQLAFFMHERLIHLLVTLTFALLAFGTFFMMYLSFSPQLLVLFVVLLMLLVPYIMHYYLLENGVQKMYKQYDSLRALALKEQNS